MTDYRAGQAFEFEFVVIDLNGNPVTGLTASSFTITLRRHTGSTDYASASEATAIREDGNGAYAVTGTLASDSAGQTYWCEVVEKSSIPDSAEATHNIIKTVSSGGVANSESDSFCSVDDVESKVQRGVYSATTKPTQAQILDFMAWRAQEIEAAMLAVGYRATVADGSAPIDTSDDEGRILAAMCRQANSTGAAGDAIHAHEIVDRGEPPERAKVLWAEFRGMLEVIVGVCQRALRNNSAMSATRSGGVTKGDFAPTGTEERSRSDLWSLDSEW